MYTDLFRALLNRHNARGHPTLSAMLYAFCPTASHWCLAGADPVLPFDPVWQSLQDLASGETLHEYLIHYGFDGLIPEILTYIREVEEYRKQHPIQSPELMPLFRGGKIPAGRRFGSQNAINNLGGDWRNLFIYVRLSKRIGFRSQQSGISNLQWTLPAAPGCTIPFGTSRGIKLAQKLIHMPCGGHVQRCR